MRILALNHAEVTRLLPMPACLDLMAGVFAALGTRAALNPLRTGLWLPDRSGVLGLMPAWLGGRGVMGAKVISVFPQNRSAGLHSHQGMVALFDAQNGLPLAWVDAAALTAIRTAAVSAVATRALARDDAAELALLGSGTQAASHLEALSLVRQLHRVRVWSRTPANARAFADKTSSASGWEVRAVDSAEAAVRGADIVCTVTASPTPVLHGDWLAPGVHVNAVGACAPVHRELDSAAVARARLFVDARESAVHEAGELLLAKQEGALDEGHIAGELADVLAGRVPGRQSATEITLFKSLGLAVEDVAAAHHVYERAKAEGAGTWIDW
jgi:alanine dehydrogenase